MVGDKSASFVLSNNRVLVISSTSNGAVSMAGTPFGCCSFSLTDRRVGGVLKGSDVSSFFTGGFGDSCRVFSFSRDDVTRRLYSRLRGRCRNPYIITNGATRILLGLLVLRVCGLGPSPFKGARHRGGSVRGVHRCVSTRCNRRVAIRGLTRDTCLSPPCLDRSFGDFSNFDPGRCLATMHLMGTGGLLAAAGLDVGRVYHGTNFSSVGGFVHAFGDFCKAAPGGFHDV